MMRSKAVKFPSLPREILIEILLLLPMQSILACKLVSKQLNHLITDPIFFNRYRDKSLVFFIANYNFYCVLLRHDTVNERCRFPPFTVFRVPVPFTNGSAYQLLSKPSNGIACVQATNGHFLFYNLFTGASYTVADSPIRKGLFGIKLYSFDSWTCYGFGYDRYADDYKIVLVHDDRFEDFCNVVVKAKLGMNTVRSEYSNQFWVYSFRFHVWKRLEGFPYDAYGWRKSRHKRACCLNGVLHWVVSTSENPNKEVIVTYDMHTCGFGEIPMPDMGYIYKAGVSELGGKLCCSWTHLRTFLVWVMEEYGVKESWRRLFRVECWMINRKSLSCTLAPMELYELRGGRKVVLCVCENRGSLYWCDIDNGEVEVIRQSAWRRTRVVGGRERLRKQLRIGG